MKILLRILIGIVSILVIGFTDIIMFPIVFITNIIDEVLNAFVDKYKFEFKSIKIYCALMNIRNKPRGFVINILLAIQLWYNNKYYKK